MSHLRISLILAILCVIAGTTFGDVAFPARMVIEETAPGRYDVIFTLPIVEGRKLRAQPILPPICSDATDREISVSGVGHTTSWTVMCDPQSLEGEAVLIEGLLGTQTDLAFTLTTLDGRVFSEILRPSRPGFLVPSPPSPLNLGGRAVVEGMRRVLQQLPLWLLMAVVVVRGAGWRELFAGGVGFSFAHGLAQWLGGHGWLLVSPLVRDFFVLGLAVSLAVALIDGERGGRRWMPAAGPAALLTGLLYGGAEPEAIPAAGLSSVEQSLALVLFAIGAGAGLLLIALVAAEIRTILKTFGGGKFWSPAMRFFGYGIGGLATGMLLARLVSLGLLAGDVQRTTVELALLALVLGPTLTWVGLGGGRALLSFVVLAVAALGPGLSGIPIPLAAVVATGSLMLLGGTLAFGWPLATRWVAAAGVVAVIFHSWSTGLQLLENVSKSTGAAAGAVLVATCVLFAGLSMVRAIRPEPLGVGIRGMGGAVAVAAILSRLADYRVWFDTQFATEAALGLIQFPALFVGLVIAALVVWSRNRRASNEPGVMQRTRVAHWVLLGLAFLLVPHGTWGLPNPFFRPHAPEGEDARRVVTSVLWETYRAFNLSDEDELYDRLAENVSGDLVNDIYLDSRRRLMAGTREGAVVTVREVEVLDIGAPRETAGFTYDCRWAVTARVSHLKHVHLRQNTYSGMLTLIVEGDRWKIGGIELESEDRVVLWASSR